jgi:hypothetical protein
MRVRKIEKRVFIDLPLPKIGASIVSAYQRYEVLNHVAGREKEDLPRGVTLKTTCRHCWLPFEQYALIGDYRFRIRCRACVASLKKAGRAGIQYGIFD